MTYDEAISEDPIITRKEAQLECQKHSVPFVELVVELGDRPEYSAKDVLQWLGY
jgi:hypothetical protein